MKSIIYLDFLVSSVEFLLVCGIADDQVIFPAVHGELSFCVQEHAEEKQRLNKFRILNIFI